MSYGQKPAAWTRQPAGAQNQQLNQNLFANQLGLATGQPFGAMPAISLNSSINALVNQAAFSNMNSVLAQAQAAQQRLIPQNVPSQQNRTAQSPPPTRNQRTFVGTVTKLMETYGFVDEDVFFQTNVIRGAMPRVGDRVMVEASFNPSMPFKWNAYRIQLPSQPESQSLMSQSHALQQQQYPARGAQQQHASGNNNAPQRWQNDRREETQRQISESRPHRPVRNEGRRSSPRRSPVRQKPSEAQKRERERSPFARESREPTRTRSPALSVAASSKREADSPPRRRQRVLPRYRCHKPKQLPPNDALMYMDLHKRYSNLYIPSDFIRCEMTWIQSIQLDAPIQFAPHPITYSVLHKDVDVPLADGDSLPVENPPDANNRYIVKVLLLSHPGLAILRQKMHGLLADGSIDDTMETQSILKHLQLLVGVKGKSEYMCIGGAWSPSLDGENALDPQTQINTAIRTTRSLVGVDLSACPKWYKMVHLHYFRTERNRVDSVVLMLPDTSSTACLMPTEVEFKELEEKLKSQLAQKLAAIDSEQFVPADSSSSTAAIDRAVHSSFTATTTAADLAAACDKDEKVGAATADKDSACEADLPDKSKETSDKSSSNVQQQSPTTGSETVRENDSAPLVASQETGTNATAAQTTATPLEGSHQADGSTLSVNNASLTLQAIRSMKVAELRDELEKRGLDSKGVKNVLLQRLQDALEKEGGMAGNGDAEINAPVATKVDDKLPSIVVKKELVEPMEVDETAKAEQNVKLAEEKAATEAEKERLEKEKKALEKAKEKFEKDKKERKASLQRHYSLPKEPSVFIYPNRNAKGGKFECKVVSLETLLEYRVDDSKETSFEAFVFAEALRESFDRANAFTVYNVLDSALDRNAERERREAALTADAPTKEKSSESLDDVIIIDSEGDKKNKKKDERKPDSRLTFKALVRDADAFSAFAYFDENVSGHIEERDLEDIIFSTGIDISRGEVQKLTKKISNRDRCNYRNLTDKWVDSEGNVKYFSTPAENTRTATELAKGHSSSLEPKDGEAALGTTPDVTDTGVVFYKGSVLNIIKTMEQHNAVEKERTAALLKNDEFDMQLKSVKKQRDHLEKNKRRLESDVDRYKKKLYEAEKCLKAAQEGSAIFKAALQDCKKYAARVHATVDKAIPPPPVKKDDKSPKDKKSTEENDSEDTKIHALNAENGTMENSDGITEEIVLTEEVGANEDGNEEFEEKDATEETNPKVAEDQSTKDVTAENTVPAVVENPTEAEKTAPPTADVMMAEEASATNGGEPQTTTETSSQ